MLNQKRRAKSRAGMMVTTIALPEEMHRELLLAAVNEKVVFTEIVRQALAEWLDRHGKKSGKEKTQVRTKTR